MKHWIIAILAGVALLMQGCSEVEPKTGTKVTFAFNKPIERDQLVAISKYLTSRGELMLGIRRPRIDSVSDTSLVLLLPGKKIPKTDIGKLIQPYSIELYHLNTVATDRAPNRPWKIKPPSSPNGPYFFTGPNAERIDSRQDPGALLKDVVGAPPEKPILTGRDILPNASLREAKSGWAVLVKFTPPGARVFYEFTKANRGEYLAVFYNGRLVSAPMIKESIPGGEAYITGFGREEQARIAVSELNGGVLPGKIKITGVGYY